MEFAHLDQVTCAVAIIWAEAADAAIARCILLVLSCFIGVRCLLCAKVVHGLIPSKAGKSEGFVLLDCFKRHSSMINDGRHNARILSK